VSTQHFAYLCSEASIGFSVPSVPGREGEGVNESRGKGREDGNKFAVFLKLSSQNLNKFVAFLKLWSQERKKKSKKKVKDLFGEDTPLPSHLLDWFL